MGGGRKQGFWDFVMIKFRQQHLQIIYSHAESTYPEECCGIILGNFREEQKTVVEIISTENAWTDEAGKFSPNDTEFSKSRRFAIAPQVMLEAQKNARSRQLDIVGIYHSHPDYPASPSEFDREFAWQGYSYLIVTVENGKATQVKSWCLDDNQQFLQEEMGIGNGE